MPSDKLLLAATKAQGRRAMGWCATTLSPIKAIMEANVKWSRREEVVVW